MKQHLCQHSNGGNEPQSKAKINWARPPPPPLQKHYHTQSRPACRLSAQISEMTPLSLYSYFTLLQEVVTQRGDAIQTLVVIAMQLYLPVCDNTGEALSNVGKAGKRLT